MKYRIATFRRFLDYLMKGSCRCGVFTVAEIERAEICIVKYVHKSIYNDQIEYLKENKTLKKHDSLVKLNPFFHEDGTLRVGGRLKNSDLSFNAMHPVIIPANHHVTHVLARHSHKLMGHLGKKSLVSFLRERY